jgi:antitoxin (DNA-binding transcriptional repressor) of toxin-antitoxin stability system
MVIVNTSGHTLTMDSVTGAGLKAKLSHYLREVREGRSFTVLSRDIPFATVGPYDSLGTDDLEITEPLEAGAVGADRSGHGTPARRPPAPPRR